MGYMKRGDYKGRRILKNLEKGGKWNEIIKYCNNSALNCKLSHTPEDGLDAHLRSDCVHIYYKGGRILEVKTDVLNIDSSYFYKRSDHDGIPRTHMELISEGNWEELNRRKEPFLRKKQNQGKVNYDRWKQKDAEAVFENLKKKRVQLFGLDHHSSEKDLRDAYIKTAMHPENYFTEAKKVMDDWSDELKDDVKHEERLLQQKISIVNKDLKESDYIVIDIEFSVSNAEDCPFRSKDKKYQNNPRFDIIAIQPKKNYRLTVIELKRGLHATGIEDDDTFNDEAKSGVMDHVYKFEATVGNDDGYEYFIREMQGVLEMKVHLGILPPELKDVEIPLEKPEFCLAYAGVSMNRFKAACEKANLKCICIEDENYPLLKDD